MNYPTTIHALADVRDAMQAKALQQQANPSKTAIHRCNVAVGKALIQLRAVLRSEHGCAGNKAADGPSPKGWQGFLELNLPMLKARRAREYIALAVTPQPKEMADV